MGLQLTPGLKCENVFMYGLPGAFPHLLTLSSGDCWTEQLSSRAATCFLGAMALAPVLAMSSLGAEGLW